MLDWSYISGRSLINRQKNMEFDGVWKEDDYTFGLQNPKPQDDTHSQMKV